MTKHRFARLLSWFAALVGVICLLGLMLTIALLFEPRHDTTAPAGLAFLVVTTWLTFTGAGALASGALSSLLASDQATVWHTRRSRGALVIGAVALGVGLVYGLTFP